MSSAAARHYGVHWRQVVVSHLNYSTPTSIERILDRTGWRVDLISEPRYWDPDPAIERRKRVVEVAKLVARMALMPLMRAGDRFPALTTVPARVSGGRITWKRLVFSIGDQAVLGDVMLVIARPA